VALYDDEAVEKIMKAGLVKLKIDSDWAGDELYTVRSCKSDLNMKVNMPEEREDIEDTLNEMWLKISEELDPEWGLEVEIDSGRVIMKDEALWHDLSVHIEPIDIS
jgi:hypothetical protein